LARAPTATDDASKGVSVDDWWYDTSTDALYSCLDNTVDAAVWQETAGGDVVERTRKSIFQVVLSTQADPYKDTASASWETMARFRYTGSDAVGAITVIYAIAHKVSGGGTGELQIYDSTNLNVIATLTGIANVVPAILDMGTLSNIPAEQAMLEIRGRRVGGGTTLGVSSVHMEY